MPVLAVPLCRGALSAAAIRTLAMGQDRVPSSRSLCLFAFPFRIFFLSAALAGAILVPVWLLLFHQGGGDTLAMPAWFWHQHEMTVGFLNAAIAGFLLTAVCNWTG